MADELGTGEQMLLDLSRSYFLQASERMDEAARLDREIQEAVQQQFGEKMVRSSQLQREAMELVDKGNEAHFAAITARNNQQEASRPRGRKRGAL